MGLLQEWREIAYNQEADKKQLQKFWTEYFLIEKGIYEKLLSNPDEVVKGTVKELADKYGIKVLTMAGFLDGINDSLKVPNPIETMDENTEVTLAFDKEMLSKDRRSAETIPAPAEAERNTNTAAAEINKKVREKASVEKRAPFLVIRRNVYGCNDLWRDLSGLFCNSPQRGHGFFRDLASGGWFSLSLGSTLSFWKMAFAEIGSPGGGRHPGGLPPDFCRGGRPYHDRHVCKRGAGT